MNGGRTENEARIPLVLDLDGTLLRTDLLYESFWAAAGRDLRATLSALARSWRAPAQLKRVLSGIAEPDAELLPVRDAILDLAVSAGAAGRPVHFASAADQGLVDAIAVRFGLPGPHFGSDGNTNLAGAAKARVLEAKFGRGGYDYAGNSAADLPSWASARAAVVVNHAPDLGDRVAALGKPVTRVEDADPAGAILREMRPRQWLKNLLLLLPALAAHHLSPATLGPVLIAIAAISLGASSIYIVNDLLDLAADRSHPEKRHRPIASGEMPIPRAMAASAMLAVAAALLGLAVSPTVCALILAYMAGSLTYSLVFKRYRWLDLLALAGLFLLRILTGAAAAGTGVSPWLFAFAFFFFLALACAKRMTEMARALRRGHLPGRSYSAEDLPALRRIAFGCTAASAGLFAGYALSPDAAALHSRPDLLALAALPVAVWLGRVVRMGAIGQEDYDPVAFVTHDRTGLAIAVVALAVVLLSV